MIEQGKGGGAQPGMQAGKGGGSMPSMPSGAPPQSQPATSSMQAGKGGSSVPAAAPLPVAPTGLAPLPPAASQVRPQQAVPFTKEEATRMMSGPVAREPALSVPQPSQQQGDRLSALLSREPRSSKQVRRAR